MPDSAYQAYVEVLPDFSQTNNIARREITSIFGSAGVSGGAAMNQGILGSIPKLATPLLGAIAALGIGRMIGDVIGQGINFALDGIDLASDLNESFNATKVAFGEEVSAQITELGEDAATRLGLTSRAFNEIATQFSAFAATVRADNPASFIDELTTRGADFASVYNLEVADALQLFQSGLAGETEPLRKFGLDLSAASVEAFAYASGIGVVGEELTEAQKVQARYGLLMQQTSKVQGDFANTSGDLANQQRVLAASYEQAQTKLGTALLPTMLLFTRLANDTLIPILNDVVEKVGPELADSLAESAPAFVELVEAIAPLIPDLVELSVDLLPPLLELLKLWAEYNGGIVQTFAAMSDFFSGDATLEETVAKVDNLSGSLGDLYRWFRDIVAGAVNMARDGGAAFAQFQLSVGSNINAAIEFVQSLPLRVAAAVSNLGSTLYGSGRALIQGFINGINDMLRPVGNAVSRIMSYVAGFFPHSPAERGPFSGAGWTAVADAGRALADQFSLGFQLEPDISFAGIGATSTVSQLRSSVSSSTSPIGSGGMTFTGDIIVADPNEFVNVVEKRRRHANIAAGLGTALIA